MSGINLHNPGVLKNFLLCQMREGKGEFSYREKVLIFKGLDGSEFVAPSDIQDKYEEAQKIKVQAKMNSEQKDLPDDMKDKEVELEELKKVVEEKEKILHPPKVEEPKVEEPKVEEPKVEEPKVEEPKVEEPKVEEPKVEEKKQQQGRGRPPLRNN